MMNLAIRLKEVAEGAFYEMTHVSSVWSRGYWMANAVGFIIWGLIVAGVIHFILSDDCDSLMDKVSRLVHGNR